MTEKEKDNEDNQDAVSLSELQVNKDIKWSEQHEKILIDWADKAMCYRWLHSRANRKFYKLNALFTIPVIIISTLTGTANFAQDKFKDEQREYAVMAIGSLNILAGIVTTIQQFLKISELNEAHRVSSVAWDKFFRNIKVELAKHPDERVPVYGLIKWAKEEFDRLIETSPVVPQAIIIDFKNSFKKTQDFHLISKPEICDELISVDKFKFKEEISFNLSPTTPKIRDIENQIPSPNNYEIIKKFYKDFFKINERYPLDNEIINKYPNLHIEDINDIMLKLKGEFSP